MKKTTLSLVLLGTSFTSTYILAAPNCVLPVNDTSWEVGAMNDDGTIGDYHSVPWVFRADGTMSSGDIWEGTWERNGCDKIRASLRMNVSGKTADFEVFFVTSQRFIATQNDALHRFGNRL